MSHALPPLRSGHSLRLLQGSGEFFPALVASIDAALHEVRLETYIFDFQGQSAEVGYALERAARRGVGVMVVVDGYGTAPLPPSWAERFLEAGVEWRIYRPLGRFGVFARGNWRRLHRKLCVVDRHEAYCGGINILDDFHDLGEIVLPAPRLDFSVRVTGPLVADVHASMERMWLRMRAVRQLHAAHLAGALHSLREAAHEGQGGHLRAPVSERPRSRAALVLRDNLGNRARIERAYRRAIGRARTEIVIANAYFVPGRRLRNALVSAARRGVKVRLLVEGMYESFMQYYASRPIYGTLLAAGVEIHEYAPSFLHAKVAVIDRRWATVGSSNLDPLSLLLAREANVMMEDGPFAAILHRRLMQAIDEDGKALDAREYARRPVHTRVLERIALVLMRIALFVQGKKYL